MPRIFEETLYWFVVFNVILFALAGLIFGSFLTVVIHRVPRKESIVLPGSACPKCGTPIRARDNLPVVSWLLLRAKCRNCGQPISIRYPMVELLTAVVAVAISRRLGPTGTALGAFAFAAALIALAYIDIDTWLLPHQITWPLLAVGLASPLWNRDLTWLSSLIGAAAGFAFFGAIAFFGEKLLKKETMGWGDVWLLAGIGAWLGWQALLPVVLLSAVQGSIVGIALIAMGRDPSKAGSPDPRTTGSPDDEWVPPKHAVPYGPFLALAALEHLLAGNRLAAAWDFLLHRLFA